MKTEVKKNPLDYKYVVVKNRLHDGDKVIPFKTKKELLDYILDDRVLKDSGTFHVRINGKERKIKFSVRII